MILDVDLIDVDEAILEAFAVAGSDGLTAAEVLAACHRFDARVVERRLGVLRDYRAISKVVDRPNEQHYRAWYSEVRPRRCGRTLSCCGETGR